MRIGVDTNVLYYAIDRDNHFHDEAKKALEALVERQMAVVTQQNLVELLVALTKRGASLKVALEIAKSYREVMPVLRPTPETIDAFFKEAENKKFKASRLFDLFLGVTLLCNGVEFIYTYNEKDFRNIEGLKVWKPKNNSLLGF